MMLSVLFGGIRSGRLSRLQYLFWSLGLTVGATALALLVGVTTESLEAVYEQGIGANAAPVDEVTRMLETLGTGTLFAVVGLIAIVIAWFFAHANLQAKRVRDMGLPGWPLVFAEIVAGALFSVFAGGVAGGFWSIGTLVALLAIPSNVFGAKGRQAAPELEEPRAA